jgi:uncharacterized protein
MTNLKPSLGVNAAMHQHIVAELHRLERELDVMVVYAAESGSRAWGFASENSDYDVRFLYVPKAIWYLTISSQRDVIERMLPQDLDLSGWELRKALRLFKRFNGALNEWLDSPIRYIEVGDTAKRLREALTHGYKSPAALHHYASMAKQMWLAMHDAAAEQRSSAAWPVSAKKLCYLLRELFACRHIQAEHCQPPTAFSELFPKYVRNQTERDWVESVLHSKAHGQEHSQILVSDQCFQSLNAEIETALVDRARIGVRGRAKHAQLDAILQSAVLAFQPI